MSLLSTIYNILVLGQVKDQPGPLDFTQIKKILLVRTDNIGDVICSTPAMVSLRKLFPQAHIAALVCTLSQDALAQHPALDELYVYPKAKHRYKGYGKIKSWWMLLQTLRAIRKQRYDLAISLRSDFSSSLAWLVYASKARWKAGPEARGKRHKLGFFYNIPLDWPHNVGHEVQYVLAVLQKMGLNPQPEKLCLALPPQAMDKARRFLAQAGITRAPVVLNVGYWPYDETRNWQVDNYLAVLEYMLANNLPVVITHGPGQGQWVEENVLAALSQKAPVFFGGHLLELAALLAQSALFITVDGGMVHVAAGAGVAVLDLVEAKHADRWYPWNVEQKTVTWQDNVNNVTAADVLQAARSMPVFAKIAGNLD